MMYKVVCPDNDEVVGLYLTDYEAQVRLCLAMDLHKAVMMEAEDGERWVLSELLVVESSEGCFVARNPQELEDRVPESVQALVMDQRGFLKGSIEGGKYASYKDDSPKPGTVWSS